MDAHSYLGIRGYPDRGLGVHPVCVSLDGPWMPIVTWALTEGCTLCACVPGWSMDAHSYLGIRGYQEGLGVHSIILDRGFTSYMEHPCMSTVT